MVSRPALSLWIALLCQAGAQIACSPTATAVHAPAPVGARLAAVVPAEEATSTPSSSGPAHTPAPAAEADEPAPLCIDGEVAMGICLCAKGKGADATGHCVYLPCAKGDSGEAVFRDETTGQCMSCPPGTKPTKDGKCEH